MRAGAPQTYAVPDAPCGIDSTLATRTRRERLVSAITADAAVLGRTRDRRSLVSPPVGAAVKGGWERHDPAGESSGRRPAVAQPLANARSHQPGGSRRACRLFCGVIGRSRLGARRG